MVSVIAPGRSTAASMKAGWSDTGARISYGDRPVVRFNYAATVGKPCIDQIFSPAGVQVLNDLSHDHDTCHGLALAFTVDGVDFSGEQSTSYRETISGAPEAGAEIFRRVNSGFFSRTFVWIGPKSAEPLLVENRVIEAYHAEGLDATLVCWQSCLKPPSEKHSVVITGTRYSGLRMRLAKSTNDNGRFFNLERDVGDVGKDAQVVNRAKWCAYSATVNEKPVTVAIFDHPENPRHPTAIFTITKPFASISATLDAWEKPIRVEAQRPLTLCYGIAVWDGSVEPATVDRLYRRWLDILRTEDKWSGKRRVDNFSP